MTDTLMNLIDEYAESRHVSGCWVYNTKTAEARQAVIEALSAAPGEQQVASSAVLKAIREENMQLVRTGDDAFMLVPYKLATAEQQATPKAAPGVGNSGFDHQTAADFLNGKTVSDEAVRKFVHAARWAHDEKAALSAMLLSVRGVLASREAEIALLKKALMEAEAAPQQEAQEPAHPSCKSDMTVNGGALKLALNVLRRAGKTEVADELEKTAQPAPAPLSDDTALLDGLARLNWYVGPGDFYCDEAGGMNDYDDKNSGPEELRQAIRAALAAQGGKA